jgi:signal transduction histidine kinase
MCMTVHIGGRKWREHLKDEFVAMVSHEGRSPLIAIAGVLGRTALLQVP